MNAMANSNATMSAPSPLAPMLLLMMMPHRNSSAVPNASQNLSENLKMTNRTISMFPPGISRPQMNSPFPWSMWFWGFHVRPRPQFGLSPPPLIQPPQQPFPGTFPFPGPQQMPSLMPPQQIPPLMPPQQMQPVNPLFPFNPALFPPMIPPMPIPGPVTEMPPLASTEQPVSPETASTETQQPQTPEPSSPPNQPTTQPSRFLFPNCGLNIRELMSKTSGRNQLRIVGGRDTPIDLIPWQVSLQRPRNYEMRHYCGGAVIHPQFILTAAHCLDWCMSQTGMLSPSIKSMRIVAGTDTPRMLNFIPGGYGGHGYNPSASAYRGPERQVAQAFIFPGYVKSKSNNDIALLRLDRPLPLFPFAKINTICLPSPEEPVASSTATTSGWGQTVEKGKQSFYLKSVNVSIVSDSQCLEAYGSKSYNPKQMLCAGDEGKDSCQGDSGGPLFQKDPSIGRMVQFGITSFGYGCARKGYPGIYTKVSSYSAWAQGIIQGSAEMM